MPANLDTLTPWMRERVIYLIKFLTLLGYRTELYSTRRTLEEQKELVRLGHSRTLNSKHLKGEAADILIFPEHGYHVAGNHWAKLGGKWGGHFKDPELAKAEKAHFQHGE